MIDENINHTNAMKVTHAGQRQAGFIVVPVILLGMVQALLMTTVLIVLQYEQQAAAIFARRLQIEQIFTSMRYAIHRRFQTQVAVNGVWCIDANTLWQAICNSSVVANTSVAVTIENATATSFDITIKVTDDELSAQWVQILSSSVGNGVLTMIDWQHPMQ